MSEKEKRLEEKQKEIRNRKRKLLFQRIFICGVVLLTIAGTFLPYLGGLF